MKNEEYLATQDLLVQAGKMVAALDLNGFRDRIRQADSIGSILDPTLYRAGQKRLQAIDELAEAAIRLKAAFQTLKSQVESELVNGAHDCVIARPNDPSPATGREQP